MAVLGLSCMHACAQGIVDQRLQESPENWRLVYKALLLLEYMVKHGPMVSFLGGKRQGRRTRGHAARQQAVKRLAQREAQRPGWRAAPDSRSNRQACCRFFTLVLACVPGVLSAIASHAVCVRGAAQLQPAVTAGEAAGPV